MSDIHGVDWLPTTCSSEDLMLFIFLSRHQQINPLPNPVMVEVQSFYGDTYVTCSRSQQHSVSYLEWGFRPLLLCSDSCGMHFCAQYGQSFCLKMYSELQLQIIKKIWESSGLISPAASIYYKLYKFTLIMWRNLNHSFSKEKKIYNLRSK